MAARSAPMEKLPSDLRVVTGPPRVRLLAHTAEPYAISIASARTCYQPKVILTGEVTEGQKDRIGKSIYEAGHHTPFQHPTFVFGLENVSRGLAWSFLHSHPYYNSEQSSQRYNLMTEAAVYVPPVLAGDSRRIYEEAVLAAWRYYQRIFEALYPEAFRIMEPLGRRKGQDEKKVGVEAEKKATETARYVVPVGAFTAMYHTVSGIELKRYVRMANTGDCPTESSAVALAMLSEVRKVDPDFAERVGEAPIPLEATLESRVTAPFDERANAAFDASLEGRVSKLVAVTPDAERLVADSVREVVGATAEALPDAEAIDLVVDPRRNPYLVDTLNTWTHSPLMRALNHVQYTFRKVLSHSADSQDQRHRTVPGSRPMLSRVHTREPDFVTPELVGRSPEAEALYEECMHVLWDAKNALVARGVPAEAAVYLLPNATRIRFTATGSFLAHLHKWRMRTCFLAQQEIYNASMDEVLQVRTVHPRLTRHIGPPCLERDGIAEPKVPEGPCPEGTRWCGIDVWRNFPRVKRPI